MSRRARGPLMVLGGIVALAAVTFPALRGREPFATWYYPMAWFPVLVALDGALGRLRGRFLLSEHPRRAASVFLWSVVVWLLFEAVNFRVENWYYVFVPDRRAAAWTGITLSFATVLPAIFLTSTLVAELTGPGDGGSFSGFRVGPRLLRGIRLAGVGMAALALAWPRYFFPLIWGSVTLLVEPTNFRRDPDRSILGDLARGRLGRIVRLLAAGAAVGLLWELLNSVARGRWIYTVPGLEELKLFEMPLPGFLGFPVFALDCFALYGLLVNLGVAAPVPGVALHGEEAAADAADPEAAGGASPSSPPGRVAVAAVVAGVLSVATLLGMERWTIDSRTPRLRDLPSLLPADVEDLAAWGFDTPFRLAASSPSVVAARIPGVEPEEAGPWVRAARLAVLRGIGTRNARLLWAEGIRSVEDLAAAEPDAVAGALEARGWSGDPARVRVWVRAAREAAR